MRLITATLAACLLAGCGSHSTQPPQEAEGTQSQIENSMQQLGVVPYPTDVSTTGGQWTLPASVQLLNSGGDTALLALQELLSQLHITQDPTAAASIELSLINDDALGAEGYRLSIADGISISANTDTGLFYAVQTLRQMLPASSEATYQLPTVEITDTPTYPWRGNMLDVARSFLPVEYVKAHIDRMSLFKLNRLHLHLSDDQGWRVEIKKYPKLTEIGGASAVEGGRSGFYSQAEIRDLVQYAAQRHVTLVPEIDLPGHTQAALAAYNELACDDVTRLGTYSGKEVGFSKLCLTKPDVIYPWVEDVLSEIVDLFPSDYIHIGGDEIKDPLYPEFIARAAGIVADLGRTAIAWEEGSVADNEPDVLLQLWNDKYDIQPALERGHKLILSPCSYTYYDHGNYQGQPNTYDWCRKEGVPLQRAYSMDTSKFGAAVGIESAMWSELVHTDATADNRLWPRLAVTAELGWSQASDKNYEQFTQRLSNLQAHLDALNIHYYPEPDLGW
ncbi:beta-N-acetylhexosaminidase [Gilvimarinus sp. SDUM040013]|uniref:beta-N-acetylhexosaminidase n=1 Tax=Gilvimarinus gilvus TaxID=3058038 RepID=A0ABU4RTT1_9GAMM|nr:beta-N-acetylhexosaminidase [Gilvimarinus sp. SDUM040013]MDO3386776.1 beta-N-acetylhexosaminidase [Gilvimarinus sp. SDUM040013]MDX6848294.1 beta-N-acetylhexosaminidase [Gilvimarinus sp. SDUM040013]